MNIRERILEVFRNEIEKPILDIDLAKYLDIEQSQHKVIFELLAKMADEGVLIATKKKKYGTPEMFGMVVGKVEVTQRGFGFVMVDGSANAGKKHDGTASSDVFIPASEMGGAMNNDRVLCKVTKGLEGEKRREGTIVKVVERANSQIVGVFQKNKSFGFVIADDKKINQDVFISFNNTMNAESGDKVVVKIIKWPEGDKKAEGKVVEVLGNKAAPGVDILSVIYKFGLPDAFPNKVEDAAAGIPTDVAPEDLIGRRDMRQDTIVTIDGPDAKDLDDAVSVKKLANGNYLLGVHIADVTHYVKEASVLDKEAFNRGTSVYLVNKVVPMLPRRLSNGICSLNPQVDRLTLSIDMEIDDKGQVVNHDIYESVICTKERMVYDDVSDILAGENLEALSRYEYLFDFFRLMEELQQILRKRRDQRGAIDFNFPEAKIKCDDDGRAIDVVKENRRIANRIIEEFMLIANETVAEHYFWMDMPFVYRIHELPNEEKIENFNKFLANFGYFLKMKEGEVHPKAIQLLLSKVDGTREEHIINKLMLRSLKQAKYSPLNEGHFGLAAKYYCHFTSPIRRYPDLQIHRIIKESLNGKLTEARIERLKGIVESASLQSSERERLAEQAERDADDMKKAEYMVSHVGEVYAGVISSVTSFGFFVELENTVEGLVRLQDLDDDYYFYDEALMQLVGERTRRTLRIGDVVEVQVNRVDIDLREIDFGLLNVLESQGDKPRIEIEQ